MNVYRDMLIKIEHLYRTQKNNGVSTQCTYMLQLKHLIDETTLILIRLDQQFTKN